jgi:hypothetical protein
VLTYFTPENDFCTGRTLNTSAMIAAMSKNLFDGDDTSSDPYGKCLEIKDHVVPLLLKLPTDVKVRVAYTILYNLFIFLFVIRLRRREVDPTEGASRKVANPVDDIVKVNWLCTSCSNLGKTSSSTSKSSSSKKKRKMTTPQVKRKAQAARRKMMFNIAYLHWIIFYLQVNKRILDWF